MAAITTSTASTATAYSNQRKVDRTSNGVLWTSLTQGAGFGQAQFFYSTDNGATWTDAGYCGNGSGSATTTYTRNHSFFIDADDYAHVVFKDNGNGFIYYRRGTPNAGRTAWTWSAATQVVGAASVDYPDVVAHREGTGWVVHVTYSEASRAYYARSVIASGGTLGAWAYTTIGGSYSTSVHTYPSIDFNHTGDGKTVAGGTPHLYVGWSAGATGSGKGIRFRKATYAAGSWTWGAEREIDSSHAPTAATSWLTCLFDGTRVILVGEMQDSVTNYDQMLYERDAADTTTVTRTLFDNVVGAVDRLMAGSATYDGAGNVYLFGREASTSFPANYRKWTRSGATFEPKVALGLGTHLSAKRGYSASRIEHIRTTGTSSPYTVTYDAITLNVAPNAPTLVAPIGGVSVDTASAQRLDWEFSDPDAGDSQSAYDLRLRPVGAASWTTYSATSPASHRDFAAGFFALGDYEWQVRTYDAAGLVGPYSASGFFSVIAAPDGPSITSPANGSTVSAETATVTWSTPNQDAYQLRVVGDLAGAPDTSTILFDTGTVVSSSARSLSVPFPDNGVTRHVQLRVQFGGLWSAPYTTVWVAVSYTPPPTPTLALTTDDAAGSIAVLIGSPAPGAGEPSVIGYDLLRRESAVGGDGIRIAADVPAGVTVDWTPASAVSYDYAVRAYGDNGTSTSSAWTNDAVPVIDGGAYGGGGY